MTTATHTQLTHAAHHAPTKKERREANEALAAAAAAARRNEAMSYLRGHAQTWFVLLGDREWKSYGTNGTSLEHPVESRGRVCDLLAAGLTIRVGVYNTPVTAADLPDVAELGDADLVERGESR